MSGEELTIEGDLALQGDRVEIQLERKIEHSLARVWEMLTDSVHLARWLAPGVIEQRPGGRVQLDFGNSGTPIDCHIRACEPPRLLAYSWSAGDDPERPLAWELDPLGESGEATRLRLTLSLPNDELVPIACAGWDAHLEMLMAALEGISIHFPADRFRQARAVFSELAKEKLAA
ncbi:MAG: SRPBCC family protein [Marinobacter sp.]|uniref:SRPBCC family protein n=1 Tax=Marinobacter sp. TaxID=50741 RepID=UPI00396E46F4